MVRKRKQIFPVVYVRHDGKTIKREAKGFSIAEIKESGLDLRTAYNIGIRYDKRRKTLLKENVKILNSIVKKIKEKGQDSKRESM